MQFLTPPEFWMSFSKRLLYKGYLLKNILSPYRKIINK